MDYTKIINDNISEFNFESDIECFVNDYLSEGDELSDLEDSIGEYADGQVPIYYTDIVKEWQENTVCHEMTIEVFGEYTEGADIHKMMQTDLYCYYEQQLREDYDKLVELVEENE